MCSDGARNCRGTRLTPQQCEQESHTKAFSFLLVEVIRSQRERGSGVEVGTRFLPLKSVFELILLKTLRKILESRGSFGGQVLDMEFPMKFGMF